MLIVLSLSVSALFAQKMNAEDILAKHLDSIGSAKNREAVKTRIIVSDVEFLLQSQNPIVGKSLIASSTEGAIFGINLDTVNYRLDKFSYDGKKVRVGFITPGVRSPLSGFIFSYGDLLRKSLLGGTLSASWALLNVESRQSKLEYKGTEKVNGKETYAIEYLPKGGADVSIRMYFDRENYRHVRSEYHRTVAGRTGADSVSSVQQVQRRYRITEDFSNYKKFGNLNLPSSYKIIYTLSGLGGGEVTKAEWRFKITDASFNQPLGDNAFDINAN